MWRRKRKLLTKTESRYLWAHWWSIAGESSVNLRDATSNDDLLERLNYYHSVNQIIDEFYDAIKWIESL